MYSEKTFKNYIFWIQVKRVVLIIVLSCIGSALGALIGSILKNTIQVSTYNTLIIIVLTLIFFAFSLLLTSGTGKEVQDGYWKIALLRKLTAIQKDIKINNELLSKAQNRKIDDKKNISVEKLKKPVDENVKKETDDVKPKRKTLKL
jgi:hypothetical protein